MVANQVKFKYRKISLGTDTDVAVGLYGLSQSPTSASYHFFNTILSYRVPVCAAISFFRSPMVSSELKDGVKDGAGQQKGLVFPIILIEEFSFWKVVNK